MKTISTILRHSLLFFFLLMFILRLQAQGWEVKQHGFVIDDMYMLNATTGWAVGASGLIQRTTDGGTTWQVQAIGTTDRFWGVHFTDANNGIVVGDGRLLKTTNGGATWTTVESADLFDVYFVNATNGWAVGRSGIILKTADKGTTWEDKSFIGHTSDLMSVYFTDELKGCVVGNNGSIYRTVDGGDTWIDESYSIFPTGGDFNSIHFIDATNGLAVGNRSTGEGIILRTEDGGDTWNEQVFSEMPLLSDVYFSNASTAWISTDAGILYKSNDAGSSWLAQGPQAEGPLFTVHFTDATTGWIAGWRNTVYKTTDGGVTWFQQERGNESGIYDISFGDAITGYAVAPDYGSPIFYKTTDGGNNWMQVSESGTPSPLFEIHFLNATTGWGIRLDGTFVKTTDGASSWNVVSTGINGNDMYFTDINNGWVVGDNGHLVKTVNGGVTWASQAPAGLTANLLCTHFNDAFHGWVVGENSAILRTTDGGDTWINETLSGVNVRFRSVHFINNQLGWVVGDGGNIYKTEDGGDSWTKQNAGTTQALYSVCFANANVGYAVGTGNNVFMTIDGGKNWTSQVTPLSNFTKVVINNGFVFINSFRTAILKSTVPVILPVRWHYFRGYANKGQSQLQWKTLQEENTEWFKVQRSSNGKDWQHIAMVAATGNTNGSTYSYTDAKPLAGINYYRLLQTDRDGQASYSKVIQVTFDQAKATDIQIKSLVRIRNDKTSVQIVVPDKTYNQLQVYTADGRLLQQQRLTELSQIVELPTTVKGIYMVNVTNNQGQRFTEKVQIQ